MTTHRSQSLTMDDNPIGLLHSRNASQALAYVQVSRAVHGMTLVTDDRELLVRRLGINDGMNLIAADHVRIEQPAVIKAAEVVKEAPASAPAPKAEEPVQRREPDDPSLNRPPMEKDFVSDHPIMIFDRSR